MQNEVREISFGKALVVILFTACVILGMIMNFEAIPFINITFSLGMDAHIPILIAAVFAGVVAILDGMRWKELEEGIINAISVSIQAILILMIIGALIGAWITAGIVPAMIYYGMAIINPQFFLPSAAIIAAAISVATGSSWTTAGTVGIALIGIAKGLGINEAYAAGAVVSGAYFGDKLSPLSDTTNLAPSVSGGAQIFDHIRYMMITTIPSFLLALLLFLFLGLFSSGGAGSDFTEVKEISLVLEETFNLSPLLLLAPLGVILLVAMKIPSIPGLLAGVGLGVLFIFLFQGEAYGNSFEDILKTSLTSMHYGYDGPTGNEVVDKLLINGGISSMMWTISLILLAMALGGVLEVSGILNAFFQPILRKVKTVAGLVGATIGTCVLANTLMGDQYLAIIMPGRMYRETYRVRKLDPLLLSRTLEDAGTVTSPLIPWNTCGATMAGLLGVEVLRYAPFAFFNWMTPLFAIVIAGLGYKIKRLPQE